MSACADCGSDLGRHHSLVAADVPAMANGSRIIEPTCSHCGTLIPVGAVSGGIDPARRVILISGPVGAGKSAVGQYIERHYGYVFIDGDAISKRLNYRARQDPALKADECLYHKETMRTMMVVLGLGYDVVVGYVLGSDEVQAYVGRLAEYGIRPLVRVLLPSRETCITRDIERPCWTAGTDFVDRWYAQQRALKDLSLLACIDTSLETVEETVALHFRPHIGGPTPVTGGPSAATSARLRRA
ncbi:MAG: AAA family ATPase [Anaerolineae bacterium]|nr:AAA family ATPase [Anaerolineae bacterium]